MSAARQTPRSRPGAHSPLTAQVEPITTSGNTQARQHASTLARPTTSDTDAWVNFSTYLPAPLRRTLKARCAALGIELREATTQAVNAWLDTHPAGDND